MPRDRIMLLRDWWPASSPGGGRSGPGRAPVQTVAGEVVPPLDASADASVARAQTLDDLVAAVHHAAAAVADATLFLFALYEEERRVVRVLTQTEFGVDYGRGEFPLGDGFTSQVIRTGQPRLVRDWPVDGPRVQIQYATPGGRQPSSGLTLPLLHDGRVLGVFALQSYRSEAYGQADLVRLQALADAAALALVRIRRSEQLDAELQRRLGEIEAVLASMADALVIIDADGRVGRMNPAARAVLCTGEHCVVLGREVDSAAWEALAPGAGAVASALAPVVAALRRGDALQGIEVPLAGAETRVLSFSCAPVRDHAGRPAGGVVVFRDVTEAVVQRTRREALVRAVRSFASKTRREEVIDALVEEATALVGGRAALYRWDEASGRFAWLRGSRDVAAPDDALRRLVDEPRPVLIESATEPGVVVPLLHEGAAPGVLVVAVPPPAPPPGDPELELLEVLAGIASATLRSIERVRLEGALLAAQTAQHEVNNALARASCYASLLMRQAALPARSREHASRILDGVLEAGRRLSQLQQVGRLEEIDWGQIKTIDLARSAELPDPTPDPPA